MAVRNWNTELTSRLKYHLQNDLMYVMAVADIE